MGTLKIIYSFSILLSFSVYAQWIQLDSGTSLDLNSVFFVNDNLGWTCGDEGIVLKTTNGGETWSQMITSNLIDLNKIEFFDSLNGIVVGTNASIYQTTNSGLSWSLKNLNPNVILNDIKYITPSRVLVVGDDGIMLLSTDNGNNWQDISDSYSNDLINISFLNQNYGWISGDFCFKVTTDGGNLWTIQSSNHDGNRVFIYNESLMYKMGWTRLPPPGYEPLMSIQKSTDLGSSWIMQYSNIGFWKSIYFCTSQIGYVLKDFGGVLSTTNQGEQWSVNPFPNNHSINAICFIDSASGWAVGIDGWILKSTNGGGVFTDVNEDDKITIGNFVLSQNFPNPFNPLTKIKFTIPSVTLRQAQSDIKVTLKVYDVLGNEISTLVNEEKSAGVYEVEFSATGGGTGLPSGIYFYQLKATPNGGQAGNFIETKKMVLLR